MIALPSLEHVTILSCINLFKRECEKDLSAPKKICCPKNITHQEFLNLGMLSSLVDSVRVNLDATAHPLHHKSYPCKSTRLVGEALQRKKLENIKLPKLNIIHIILMAR